MATSITKQSSEAYNFLSGGGEMGELTRSKDWSKTPVGTPDSWPQSLRTTLGVLLNSRFPMFLWWGPELVCFYNDAYRPSLGLNGKHPAILGIPAEEAWPEIWTIIKPLIDQVLAGGEATWSEDQLIPIFRNGKIEDVYWTFSYSPVKDELGQVGGVLVTCSETTGKVLAYKKLEERDSRFRNTVRQAPIGITILRGRDYMVEMANDAYLQVVDRKEKDFVGKPLFDSLPEVESTVHPLLDHVLTTGIPFHGFEYPIPVNRYGKHEVSYFNFLYHPLREDDGTISGIIVTVTDVSESVKAKHFIAESETQFRNMVMQSPIPMTIIRGKDHIIEIANKVMFEDIWRKNESDVVGKSILSVFPELKEQKYVTLLNEVLTTGRSHSEKESVAFIDSGDGRKKFYLDFEYSPLFEKDGSISGIMITVNDVTQRVEARHKIEENEEKLNIIIDSSDLGTWELNVKTKELAYSDRYLEILGFSAGAELTHEEIMSHLHPEDLSIREEAFKKAFETGILHYESRLIWKDGSIHWMEGQGKVVAYNNDKEPVLLMGTVRDITDEKYHQQELLELDKQKDYFISLASHELKTPVTSVKGYVQLLQNIYADSDDTFLKHSLATMDKQIVTLTNLITELLDLSKIKAGSLVLNNDHFNINELVTETVDEIRHIHPRYNINVSLAPGCNVYADRDRIGQVLLNFLTNAVKYSPDSREIEVKSFIEADHVTVSVKDTGIGINKQDQEKIFERFYRVEGKNEKTFPGFGIGLFISAEIIHRHKGTIAVESEPGKGSVFYFSLPLVLSREL